MQKVHGSPSSCASSTPSTRLSSTASSRDSLRLQEPALETLTDIAVGDAGVTQVVGTRSLQGYDQLAQPLLAIQ
jgi:hypothetical protein